MNPAMGWLWFSSVAIYGRAAGLMGAMGGSGGWAVFIGMCVLTSNLWGIATGEWKDGRGIPLRTMCFGLGVMPAAIALIGCGNSPAR